mmetsp:Transcript_25885/g.33956  ORF Transcript_25885/g.33956 Transcript_25885/m.33956 type:complete len:90 (+) Transcript_25885:220-489(+)
MATPKEIVLRGTGSLLNLFIMTPQQFQMYPPHFHPQQFAPQQFAPVGAPGFQPFPYPQFSSRGFHRDGIGMGDVTPGHGPNKKFIFANF